MTHSESNISLSQISRPPFSLRGIITHALVESGLESMAVAGGVVLLKHAEKCRETIQLYTNSDPGINTSHIGGYLAIAGGAILMGLTLKIAYQKLQILREYYTHLT